MANQFADGTNLLITVVDVVDAGGNPTTLSTPPTWTTSDPTVLVLTPASDGLSATGTVLKTGTVTVTATSGSLTASVAITGISGQAVSFQLSVVAVPPTPPNTPPNTQQPA